MSVSLAVAVADSKVAASNESIDLITALRTGNAGPIGSAPALGSTKAKRIYSEGARKAINYYGRLLIRQCQNRVLSQGDLVIVLAESSDDELYLARVDHYEMGRNQCKITRSYPFKMSRWVPVKRLQAVGRDGNQKGPQEDCYPRAVGSIYKILRSFQKDSKLPTKDILDFQDWDKTTPLHAAARSRSYEVVRYLLRKRADPLKRDIVGQTPLHVATTVRGNVDVIRELIEGVGNGRHKGSRRPRLKAKKKLKDLIEMKDSIGRTALMNACMAVNTETSIPLSRLESQNYVKLNIFLWIHHTVTEYNPPEDQVYDSYAMTPRDLLYKVAEATNDERLRSTEIVFHAACSSCRTDPIVGLSYENEDKTKRFCRNCYLEKREDIKLDRVKSGSRMRMQMGVLLIKIPPTTLNKLSYRNCQRLNPNHTLQSAGVHRNSKLVIAINAELDAHEKALPLPKIPEEWENQEFKRPKPPPTSPTAAMDNKKMLMRFVSNKKLTAGRNNVTMSLRRMSGFTFKKNRKGSSSAMNGSDSRRVLTPKRSQTADLANLQPSRDQKGYSPTKFEAPQVARPDSPSVKKPLKPLRLGSPHLGSIPGMNASQFLETQSSPRKGGAKMVRSSGDNYSTSKGDLTESNAVIKLILDATAKVTPADVRVNTKDKAGYSAFDYSQSDNFLSLLIEAEDRSREERQKRARKHNQLSYFSPSRSRIRMTQTEKKGRTPNVSGLNRLISAPLNKLSGASMGAYSSKGSIEMTETNRVDEDTKHETKHRSNLSVAPNPNEQRLRRKTSFSEYEAAADEGGTRRGSRTNSRDDEGSTSPGDQARASKPHRARRSSNREDQNNSRRSSHTREHVDDRPIHKPDGVNRGSEIGGNRPPSELANSPGSTGNRRNSLTQGGSAIGESILLAKIFDGKISDGSIDVRPPPTRADRPATRSDRQNRENGEGDLGSRKLSDGTFPTSTSAADI